IVESAGYRLRVTTEKQLDADIDALDPDLILAGPSGGTFSPYELTAHVQLIRPRGTLPVVLIGAGDAMESARCGADAHLDLPLSPPLLLTTTAPSLDRARASRLLVTPAPVSGALRAPASAAR